MKKLEIQSNRYRHLPYYPRVDTKVMELVESKKYDGHELKYPKISKYCFMMTTKLRVLHKGKWYLAGHVLKHQFVDEPKFDQRINIIKNFYAEVYRSINLIIIDPELKDEYGDPVYPLDEDQRSEVDRLKAMGP